MLDLKTIKEIRISEGSVKKITNSSGVVLWQKQTGSSSSLDVDLNNQWIASTKTLDGYKVYMSNSNKGVNNGYASMKFKFKGMPNFKLWINSYAESNYDYTVAWNLDVNYPTSNPQYNSSGVKAHTKGKQYNPTSISNFTEVDYSNDGGEHFVVVTYRKDGSDNSNDDRGYVAVKFTLLSTTWVVSATEFIKKDDKYYQRLNEVETYTDGSTALTGNYKEGNELVVTYKQGTADDYMFTDGKMYYKNYIYVTPKDQEINTGDYIQGDYIGHITNAMYVKYLDDTEKIFTGLTTINSSDNIKNAKKVEIYDGVTSIGYYAFNGCSHLTSITIPDSVTSIDQGAFKNCSNLESVTIQNSTSKLEYNYQAFEGISSTAKLYVPAKLLSQYKSDSHWTDAFKGGIFAIEKLLSTTWVVSSSEFVKKDDKYYERLNEVGTYEGGVTGNTGNYKEGNELTPTYIQSSDATDYMIVGSGKYYKNYIYVTPKDQEINTGDYVQGDYIGEATPSMKVTYTDGSEKTFYELTSIEEYTDPNKENAKEVEIYDGVTTIGWGTFDGCSKLESATIPNSVTNIKNYAFRGCSKLSSITIPNSVTSIGEYSFDGCSHLTSITIPDSVTSINQGAFQNCTNLTEVTIGSGAIKLGYASYSGCTSLKTMTVKATNPPLIFKGTIPTTIQTIYVPANSVNDYKSHYEEFDDGYYGWENFADKIKAIPIPAMKVTYVDGTEKTFNNLTTIGENTDSNKKNAKSVEIYDSVTEIGNKAFYGCSNLTYIRLPESVTSIGEEAFYNCTYLTNIAIPNSVTNIGNYAFFACVRVTSITLSDSLTTIGEGAFKMCGSLTSITIPANVTTIGNNVFDRCPSLTTMTVNATTPPSIGDNFLSTNYLGEIKTNTIYVPAASLDAYKSATNWSAFASKIKAIGT